VEGPARARKRETGKEETGFGDKTMICWDGKGMEKNDWSEIEERVWEKKGQPISWKRSRASC